MGKGKAFMGNNMKFTELDSICLDREHTMRFTRNLVLIREPEEEKKAFILRCGRPMPSRCLWLGILMAGIRGKCAHETVAGSEFMSFLFRGEEREICINSALRRETERELYKADPYGNEAELRPGTASKVLQILPDYKWGDAHGWKNGREFDHKKQRHVHL